MKHLTYDERLQIQKALTLKCSFIEIASKVGKDRTTISREVRAYAKYVGKPARSKCKFKCIFEDQTKCPAPGCTKRVCSIACSRCAQYCDRYEPQTCKKLTRAPYVCNGCDDRGHCSLMKKCLLLRKISSPSLKTVFLFLSAMMPLQIRCLFLSEPCTATSIEVSLM